ncbi:hypothetical protein TSUD_210960 [Trifolium subterraneum]|uniref:Uncharacterized protein n=1 Tax=Trifolium subterraneum TaxID=3900 RepID=A0A2Z6NA80_TRISU|nr:hypothetical protein TSUD_210960 [Trifolium subterraneum]
MASLFPLRNKTFWSCGGGCNGIGAWMYYVVGRSERRRKVEESEPTDCSSSCPMLIAGSR